MRTQDHRKEFLEGIWIPFIAQKRDELWWHRWEDLAKLDQEAEEEAYEKKGAAEGGSRPT